MVKRFYCWGVAVYLAAASTLLAADKKPAVFVAERDSAQITSSGDTAGITGGGSGNSITAATIKDLNHSCPDATVTLDRRSADYVLIVGDTHGFPLERDKQAVVASADGKVVFTTAARLLGNAVKDACGAIVENWPAQSSAKVVAFQKPSVSQSRP
jgi:hypothetical protein